MSNHNICLWGEIRKILCKYHPLPHPHLSAAMLYTCTISPGPLLYINVCFAIINKQKYSPKLILIIFQDKDMYKFICMNEKCL